MEQLADKAIDALEIITGYSTHLMIAAMITVLVFLITVCGPDPG